MNVVKPTDRFHKSVKTSRFKLIDHEVIFSFWAYIIQQSFFFLFLFSRSRQCVSLLVDLLSHVVVNVSAFCGTC